MTPRDPRILLATSGSDASQQATIIAADLASTFNAQLTIVHVLAPLEYRAARLGPTVPIIQRLDDPLTDQVLLDARRVAWERGTNARIVLVAGDPGSVITTACYDIGADLLVIGHTPRLMPRALAARTRRWVDAHAPCPVLPIAAKPPLRARPAVEPVLVT